MKRHLDNTEIVRRLKGKKCFELVGKRVKSRTSAVLLKKHMSDINWSETKECQQMGELLDMFSSHNFTLLNISPHCVHNLLTNINEYYHITIIFHLNCK